MEKWQGGVISLWAPVHKLVITGALRYTDALCKTAGDLSENDAQREMQQVQQEWWQWCMCVWSGDCHHKPWVPSWTEQFEGRRPTCVPLLHTLHCLPGEGVPWAASPARVTARSSLMSSARPKSASLSCMDLVNNTFSGLMSRCMLQEKVPGQAQVRAVVGDCKPTGMVSGCGSA